MQHNFLEPTELPEQAECLPELLYVGKDEMNLAEFPLTLLSDRPKPEETSLRFEDQIYDDRKKKLITRKRVIEGSKEYGLPTATDDAVILALIQLTKLRNGFTAREVEFSRHELITMLNWPNKGQSYERIALSLHRVAAVTYHFDNSWWDNRRKAWTTKIFGIVDTVELNDSREARGQNGPFPSRIIWNQIIFDSFQAGYLRSIDFQLAMSFRHIISMRIYRFMGKRFYIKPDWEFELRDFAFEHIGLSRNYEGGTQVARKLKPALEELENVGFLGPLSEKERFVKKGRNWSIRLIRKSPAPSSSIEADTVPVRQPTLAATLIDRGVTEGTALELARDQPAEVIEQQIDAVDWLRSRQDKRIAKNPAGYLVTAIMKRYAPPVGFVPKVERERQAAVMEAEERDAIEARRRKMEADAAERSARATIAAYWERLSRPERAEREAGAVAEATPDDLAALQGPLRQAALRDLRDRYIRKLLQAEGTLPPARE